MTSQTPLTFADLPVGQSFRFTDGPHPLGWPDGPWTKVDAVTVASAQMVAAVEDVTRPVARHWTEAEVRDELPDVQVLWGGAVHRGRLGGRKLRFATAHFAGGYRAEWPWSAVVRSLNSGEPLRGW